MTANDNRNRLIVALATTLSLAACGNQASPPPAAKPAASTAPAPQAQPAATAPAAAPAGVAFASVELGNGVNASGNALSGAATTTFGQKDTIYALVTTSAPSAEPAKISARWTFGESTLVNESTRDVAAAGNSVTEFHISKPDGWPVGKYAVAISIDGKPVGSKEFEVQ